MDCKHLWWLKVV